MRWRATIPEVRGSRQLGVEGSRLQGCVRGQVELGDGLTLTLLLVLASIAGTWGLVVAMQQRYGVKPRPPEVVAPVPAKSSRSDQSSREKVDPVSVPPPPVDPTPKELVRLAALTAARAC